MFQEVVELFSSNCSYSEILYFKGFGPKESQWIWNGSLTAFYPWVSVLCHVSESRSTILGYSIPMDSQRIDLRHYELCRLSSHFPCKSYSIIAFFCCSVYFECALIYFRAEFPWELTPEDRSPLSLILDKLRSVAVSLSGSHWKESSDSFGIEYFESE